MKNPRKLQTKNIEFLLFSVLIPLQLEAEYNNES